MVQSIMAGRAVAGGCGNWSHSIFPGTHHLQATATLSWLSSYVYSAKAQRMVMLTLLWVFPSQLSQPRGTRWDPSKGLSPRCSQILSSRYSLLTIKERIALLFLYSDFFILNRHVNPKVFCQCYLLSSLFDLLFLKLRLSWGLNMSFVIRG